MALTPREHIIYLDFASPYAETIEVNQYDKGTNKLKIILSDNGTDYDISGMDIKIGGTKPSGKQILNNADSWSGNIVYYTMTDWDTSEHGQIRLEVKVYDNGGNLLKNSHTFIAHCSKGALDEEKIIDSPEFSALTDAFNKVNVVIEEGKQINEELTELQGELEVLQDDLIVLKDETTTAKIEAIDATQKATTATSAMNTLHDTVTTAETTRVSNENARKTAETARATAEAARMSAEAGRTSAESNRVTTETSRTTSETNRQTAESSRVNAENNRVTAENTRTSNENIRKSSENARIDAENLRQTNTQTAIENANQAADKANIYSTDFEKVLEDHFGINDNVVSSLTAWSSNKVNNVYDTLYTAIGIMPIDGGTFFENYIEWENDGGTF